MGLLDKMKKATGLGLSDEEMYVRAYEKGVFTGDYEKAADNFGKAAEKFQKVGNTEGYDRAMANKHLYLYKSLVDRNGEDSAQIEAIDNAVSFLKNLSSIEEIGSQTDFVSTEPLIQELVGFKNEIYADQATEEAEKVKYYMEACKCFEQIGESLLVTRKDRPARNFYYFHLASANYHQGLVDADMAPNDAITKMEEAFNAFRLCEIDDRSALAERQINFLKVTERCWICGREIQGEEFHFTYYPATITPYYEKLAEAGSEGQPATKISPKGLPMCTACGSMFAMLADKYATLRANEVREELREFAESVGRRFDEMTEWINDIVKQMNKLTEVAHRHD